MDEKLLFQSVFFMFLQPFWLLCVITDVFLAITDLPGVPVVQTASNSGNNICFQRRISMMSLNYCIKW